MSYYVVCSLLVFICTMNANATEPKKIRLVGRENGGEIAYYETSNNVVFAEQYQLKGMIEGFRVTETTARFNFSGIVQMTISGAQLASPDYHYEHLKWQVKGLAVNVSRWNDEAAARWGTVPATFVEFCETARDMSNKKMKVKMAIQCPEFVFCDTGDLLCIEADQVVLKRLEGAAIEVTGTALQPTSSPVVGMAEPQCQDAFDLKRAWEIVEGTVASQMVEKVTIYHKWFDDGPEDGLHVAGVFDKESDVLSLISALKQSWVPPEPKDPLIKCGNWSGFEFRFTCKDHRDAVLSIFVGDGYYHMMGHRNPGENYNTLGHQMNVRPKNENACCFIAQNLLIGKWLEAHGLPFREGTKKKTERKDSR